jgi:hypothetical protein
LKQFNNRLTLDNLRLAERYQNGKLCLHIHIVRNVLGPAEYFCTFLQKFDVGSLPDGSTLPSRSRAK